MGCDLCNLGVSAGGRPARGVGLVVVGEYPLFYDNPSNYAAHILCSNVKLLGWGVLGCHPPLRRILGTFHVHGNTQILLW